MTKVWVTVYVLSIVTLVYRAWSVESRKTDPYAWAKEGDWVDWLFIAFIVLCPFVNTMAALGALIAIYEDDGESK